MPTICPQPKLSTVFPRKYSLRTGVQLMRLLILEDDPKDLLRAADAAHAVGINVIDAFTELGPAKAFLDLSLGYESGYELLRAWHSARAQSKVRMIVWSRLEDTNPAICELFRIDAYVSKWDGESALREALRCIAPATVN